MSDCKWARGGARKRNRSSRFETGKYFYHARRAFEDSGFWLGQADRAASGRRDGHAFPAAYGLHGRGGGAGNGGIYVAGASTRTANRSPLGYFFVRHDSVRNAFG